MTFTKPTHFNLFRAFRNSLQGVAALWQHEKAFRLEVYLFLPAAILMLFLQIPSILKMTLILLFLFLLLTEAINSAIETVVDRISLEIHEKSRRAKDMGSAAVGIAVLMNIITWLYAICLHFS